MSKSLVCCCVVKGHLGQAGPVDAVAKATSPSPVFSVTLQDHPELLLELSFSPLALMPF